MRSLVGSGIAGLLLALAATPAHADVKAGVDAWDRGDYGNAIKQWRPLAIKGDADAQFNLAQAYRFGRGVPQDMKQAEEWYRKAAAQGHFQAEDNLGLILFQNGDRAGAMPMIERSANRGDPRAQYVLGTALFNGDIIAKDWVRAYALMTRASASGLPAASSSLAQMDKYIPVPARQKGLAMARDLEARAQRPIAALTPPPTASRPAPAQVETRPIPKAETKPVRTAQVPASRTWSLPSAGALPPPPRTRKPDPQPAPAPVEVETETLPPAPVESTSEPYTPAGATYEPAYPAPQPRYSAPKPKPVVAKPAAAKPVPAKPKPAAPAASPSGKWRVQLGAFSDASNARALWSRVGGRVGGQPYFVKAGSITRLHAGPYASRWSAEAACRAAKGAGSACVVVAP